MQNQYRNPILIIIFSVIGMTIRYLLFYFYTKIRGRKPRGFYSFSKDSNQIIYNIILTLIIMFSLFLIIIYNKLHHNI